jgi:hypothetical protein
MRALTKNNDIGHNNPPARQFKLEEVKFMTYERDNNPLHHQAA